MRPTLRSEVGLPEREAVARQSGTLLMSTRLREGLAVLGLPSGQLGA